MLHVLESEFNFSNSFSWLTVIMIGEQQTKQSSVYFCSLIEASITIVISSPQFGQTILCSLSSDIKKIKKLRNRTLILIGFGGGAHRCAGVNFAKLEIKIILAKLIQNYEITLVDKNPKPKLGVETKWPESPCRIRYKKKRNA